MIQATPQPYWNSQPVTVTSHLLPGRLWQAASIDVFIDGRCILQTGGQLKITGAHSATFDYAGTSHEVRLTWGHARLRSFPVHVWIDDRLLLETRVYTGNWPLGLWPLAAIAGFTAYLALR